jgi:hypothetical protein
MQTEILDSFRAAYQKKAAFSLANLNRELDTDLKGLVRAAERKLAARPKLINVKQLAEISRNLIRLAERLDRLTVALLLSEDSALIDREYANTIDEMKFQITLFSILGRTARDLMRGKRE